MEDWVHRALAKWPNVPALYGWLALDRRGHWRIKGEPITRPQIVATLNANYAADERGCWYFQNGPQRGYVAVEVAPLVLRVEAATDAAEGEALVAHTGATVARLHAVHLDEEGSLLLATDLGPGLLAQEDLDWALGRLATAAGVPLDEPGLAAALAIPSGSATALRFRWGGTDHTVQRLDAAAAPAQLGFVREPQPASTSTSAPTPTPTPG